MHCKCQLRNAFASSLFCAAEWNVDRNDIILKLQFCQTQKNAVTSLRLVVLLARVVAGRLVWVPAHGERDEVRAAQTINEIKRRKLTDKIPLGSLVTHARDKSQAKAKLSELYLLFSHWSRWNALSLDHCYDDTAAAGGREGRGWAFA
jgi:hypothetical protein